jgi:hypothetical protein
MKKGNLRPWQRELMRKKVKPVWVAGVPYPQTSSAAVYKALASIVRGVR